MRGAVTQATGLEKGVGTMALSALISGSIAYFVAAPFYLQKTKLQGLTGFVSPSGVYTSGISQGQPVAFSNLLKSARVTMKEGGGVLALWRGTSVLMIRGCGLTIGHLTAYDWTKTTLKRPRADNVDSSGHGSADSSSASSSPEGKSLEQPEHASSSSSRLHLGGTTSSFSSSFPTLEDGPLLHVVASVHAAFWASTLCLPFDVLMTRYQTSAQAQRRGGGPLGCAVGILRTDGPAVFFRGWVPMFLRLSPMFIVSSTLFEQCRRLLGVAYFD